MQGFSCTVPLGLSQTTHWKLGIMHIGCTSSLRPCGQDPPNGFQLHSRPLVHTLRILNLSVSRLSRRKKEKEKANEKEKEKEKEKCWQGWQHWQRAGRAGSAWQPG